MGKKRVRDVGPARVVFELAADMEEPLNESVALVQAARFAGEAMIAQANPECGEHVIAVAEAALGRLEALSRVWRKLFRAASEAKAAA